LYLVTDCRLTHTHTHAREMSDDSYADAIHDAIQAKREKLKRLREIKRLRKLRLSKKQQKNTNNVSLATDTPNTSNSNNNTPSRSVLFTDDAFLSEIQSVIDLTKDTSAVSPSPSKQQQPSQRTPNNKIKLQSERKLAQLTVQANVVHVDIAPIVRMTHTHTHTHTLTRTRSCTVVRSHIRTYRLTRTHTHTCIRLHSRSCTHLSGNRDIQPWGSG